MSVTPSHPVSKKSRHGCQRCKDKHIKCDEAKPECRNCVNDGASCPGVGRPLRWSRKHEISSKVPGVRASRVGNGYRKENHARLQQARTHGSGPLPPPTPDQSETSPQSLLVDGFTCLQDFDQTPGDWLDIGLGEDGDLSFQDLVFPGQDVGGRSLMPFPPIAGPIPLGLNSWPLAWNPGLGVYRAEYGEGEPSPSVSETAQTGISEESGRTNRRERDDAERDREAGPVQSAALLHTFYRLSSPNKVPGFSDADLVGHFFKHVCRLYSCFDSKQNPFRRLVAEYWSSCPTICLTIQSMALAHVANWYPYMASLGVAKRSQAWRALHQDLQLHRVNRLRSKTTLLSLLLLGLSSTWHHSSNLSLQYLCIARNLIQRQLQGASTSPDTETSDDREFFTTALVHWEMLASFIDPVSITPFSGHGMPALIFPPMQKPVFPHPWTGVATEFHFALAEIGRVMRRQRSLAANADSPENDDTSIHHEDRHWAGMLEKFLRTTNVATEDEIADYGDPMTPKTDLIQIARAYQCVGLLEIYRVFPDILMERVSDREHGGLQFSLPENHVGYARALDSYSAGIAVQIADLLETVSLSSGACRLQPVLLVAAAGQLRIPECDTSSELVTTERYDQVLQCRFNVEERMLALSRKFPQKPLLRMMDIVKEVWHRLDDGADSHWIDVINEKGWQTIMG